MIKYLPLWLGSVWCHWVLIYFVWVVIFYPIFFHSLSYKIVIYNCLIHYEELLTLQLLNAIKKFNDILDILIPIILVFCHFCYIFYGNYFGQRVTNNNAELFDTMLVFSSKKSHSQLKSQLNKSNLQMKTLIWINICFFKLIDTIYPGTLLLWMYKNYYYFYYKIVTKTCICRSLV